MRTPSPDAGTTSLGRSALDYLAGSPVTKDPEIRDRLFQTVLDRRHTAVIAFVGTLALASMVLHLTSARWPIAWVIADIVLIALRWRLMVRALDADLATRSDYSAALIALGLLYSLFVGIACFLSIGSGVFGVIAVALVISTANTCVVASRNAATPRHARIVMLAILVPTAAACMMSSVDGLLLTGILLLPLFVSLLGVLAQNHDILIWLIEAERTSRIMAETDPLTGLGNRASFVRALDTLRHGEGGRDYAALCIDLDGFKAVNDRHGHAAGDRLLRAVAHRLRSAVRAGDLTFRIGGDEFVVLLFGAGLGDCSAVAGRLLAEIARPVECVEGVVVRVGLSIGTAGGRTGERDPEDVLRAADTALYRAKHAGGMRHVHGAVASGAPEAAPDLPPLPRTAALRHR